MCLYLEVTNRCNLLCETCPRTFEELEPPADMSWELFTRIVDQVPDIARVVLHGVGEPMLVKALPRMIRYLKDRGVYVLFNTNGTLLAPKKHRELIDTGLDELRVSLDAADAKTFLRRAGQGLLRPHRAQRAGVHRICSASSASTAPRVSLWLTGLQETVDQLPAFVRLADTMGVKEVHLQRLVFDEAGYGMARPESSLFEQRARTRGRRSSRRPRQLGAELGITLDASGATEPGLSLQRQDDAQPWSTCRRPWSLMYFTAHGRALPCCIAPFSARGYENYTLGDATQQTLREIWNSPAYQDFRGIAAERCAAAAMPEMRAAMESVTAARARACAVIPTLNEAATIAARDRSSCRAMSCTRSSSPTAPAATARRTIARGRRRARGLADRTRLRPRLRRRRRGGRSGLRHHPVPGRRRRRPRPISPACWSRRSQTGRMISSSARACAASASPGR